MAGKVMEKEVTVSIPESLRDADADFEVALFILENLSIIFKRAALWNKHNPGLGGLSWGAALGHTVGDQLLSLQVKASDFEKAAMGSVQRSRQKEAAFHRESFLNEVSKLHTFLSLITVVAEEEDESIDEHRDKVDWAETFEIFHDMVSSIAESNAALWDYVTGQERDVSLITGGKTVEQ